MSNSIDQKIVEMVFKNDAFERGISKTMGSLQKLDSSLAIKNGVQGIKDVDASLRNVDFSALNDGLEASKGKFDALGIAATTAVGRIANAAMDTGTKILKAFTVDPLTDGLNEYKLKMDSITTIKTNTAKYHTTMEDITATLQELNNYADKTIYNFADMTHNIGMFTAAGVGLEDSATAIQGISNVAAASGASAADASRAMYNLSQALATGTVKLIDWNSVQNANMGGQLFQNALIRTSEVMQTGAKAAIEAQGSFRDSLKENWLTADVLVQTLKNFTRVDDEFNRNELKSLGYTDEMIEEILDEAERANDAATKVKTVQQLIDTTKEALGSGWAVSWEWIIGNLDEASELFTNVSQALNGIIDGMSDARNKVLKEWHEGSEEFQAANDGHGGYWFLVQALYTLGETVSALVEPIVNGFSVLFNGINGFALAEASKSFYEFTQGLKSALTETATGKLLLTTLQLVFTALGTAIKVVATIVGGVLVTAFNAAFAVINVVGSVIEGVVNAIGTVFIMLSDGISSFSRIFNQIGDFFSKTAGLDNIASMFYGIGDAISGFSDRVFAATSWTAGFTGVIDTLSNSLGVVSSHIAGVGADVGKWLGSLVPTLKSSDVRNGLDNIINFFDESLGWHKTADIFKDIAADFGLLAKNWGMEGGAQGLDRLKEFMSFVGSSSVKIGENLDYIAEEGVRSLTDSVSSSELRTGLNGFISGFQELFGLSDSSDAVKDLTAQSALLMKTWSNADVSGMDKVSSLLVFFGESVNIAAGELGGRILEAFNNFKQAFGDILGSLGGAAGEIAISVLNAFASVLTAIAPIVQRAASGIATFASKVKEAFASSGLSFQPFISAFKGIKDAIVEFFNSIQSGNFNIDSFKNLFGSIFDSIGNLGADIFPKLGNAISGVISGLGSAIGGPLGEFFQWVSSLGNPLELLVGLFGKLKDAISSVVGGEVGAPITERLGLSNEQVGIIGKVSEKYSALGKVIGVLTHPIETISSFVATTLQSLGKGIDQIVKSLDTDKISEFLSKVAGLAAVGSVVYGLKTFGDAMKSVSGFFEGFGDLFESIGNLSKNAGKLMKSAALLNVILSIGILVGALAALTKMATDNPEGMGKGMRALAILMAEFAVFYHILMSTADERHIDPKVLLSMAAALLSFMTVMKTMVKLVQILGNMTPGELVKGIGALGFISLFLGGLMVALSKFNASKASKAPKDFGAIAAMLAGFAAVVISITAAVAILGQMPIGQLLKGAVALGLMTAFMAAVTAFLSSKFVKTSSTAGLMAMAESVLVIAAAIGLLAMLPTDDIGTAVSAVFRTLLMLTGVMAIMSQLKPNDFAQAASSLVIMSASVLILAAAIGALAVISNVGDLGGATASVLTTLIALAAVAAGMAMLGPAMEIGAKALIQMGIVLAVVSGIIIAFTQFDFGSQIIPSILALVIAIGVLAGGAALLGFIGEAFSIGLGVITLFAVGLGVSAALIAASVLMLSIALKNIASVAPEAGTAIVEGIVNMANGISSNVDSIAAGVASLGSAMITGFMTIAPQAVSAIGTFIQMLGQALIQGIPSLVMGGLQLIIGLILGLAQGIREHGGEVLNAIGELALSVLEGLGGLIGGGLAQIQNFLHDITGGIVPAAEVASQDVGNAMGEGVQQGTENMKTSLSEGEQALDTSMTNMENRAANNSIMSNYTSSLNGAPLDYNTFLNSEGLGSTIGSLREKLAAGGVDMASAFGGQFASAMQGSDIEGLISSVTSSAGDEGAAEMESAGEASGAAYGEGVAKAGATVDITSLVMGSGGIDTEALGATWRDAGATSGTNYYEGLTETLSTGGVEQISASVEALTQPDQFSSAGQANGSAMVEALSAAMEPMVSNCSNTVSNAISGVGAYAGSAHSQGYSVGFNLGAGVVAGLQSQVASVEAASARIIEAATKAMNAKAAINSPSKVTMKTGSGLGEGLIVGMDRMRSAVRSSAEDLMLSAMGGMTVDGGYISELLGGMEDNPVIRPVLDLDEYMYGINQMNAMMPTSQLMSAGRFMGTYAVMNPMSNRLRGDNNYHINLNYTNDADANRIFSDLTNEIRSKNLMEA